jgi:hypothetical protein
VSGLHAVGSRRSALLIIRAFSSRHLLSLQVAGSASPTWLFGSMLLIIKEAAAVVSVFIDNTTDPFMSHSTTTSMESSA